MPTVVNRATIDAWFETLDKPSQDQFKTAWFSMRHKLEKIEAEDLSDELTTIINSINNGVIPIDGDTASFDVPAGKMLDDIVIVATSPDEFSGVCIGFTDGGRELVNNETVVEKAVFGVKYYCKVPTTIYFSSINENAIIILYIK